MYKDENSVDLAAPKLKATIVQILGRAKSIIFDESSGIVSVEEFEPQSFVEPAQGSPHRVGRMSMRFPDFPDVPAPT